MDELMDDGMPSRTAHSLGWWLWRKHYAQGLQQRRQRWEELGEEGNESQSEVEELESLGEKETIWLVCAFVVLILTDFWVFFPLFFWGGVIWDMENSGAILGACLGK